MSEDLALETSSTTIYNLESAGIAVLDLLDRQVLIRNTDNDHDFMRFLNDATDIAKALQPFVEAREARERRKK